MDDELGRLLFDLVARSEPVLPRYVAGWDGAGDAVRRRYVAIAAAVAATVRSEQAGRVGRLEGAARRALGWPLPGAIASDLRTALATLDAGDLDDSADPGGSC